MDNQHRKIAGYRELSQEEIDLMNRIKAHGRELGELLIDVSKFNAAAAAADSTGADLVRNSEAHRWAAIAKTDLQTGLMALTRAVAKPAFF